MSTETTQDHRDPGLAVLLAAALAAVGVGLLAVAAAAVVDGRPAALGAAVGAGAVLTVLVFGSFAVHVVAQAMPSASLLVAILTYGLQIVALTAVMTSLDRNGSLGETVSGGWLVVGVVAITLAWVIAQVWFGARARIPAYDLREPATDDRQEAGAR
ncbi:hypothetical protein [Nocardioides campestrisoli]|uniref:hypothetical protein n=1 Tax=Nocardioides campestrisoli TaxID=2736757 RepID=UPI00163D9DF8|nr:hypothetical protein [Nocardioides campestrisoli]